MEIKRFGNPTGKKMMLLHGNLMCWRQLEDVIPLLKEEFDVYAVSFDGFDGTGKQLIPRRRNRQISWKSIYSKIVAEGWIYFMRSPLAADRPYT